MRPNMNKILSMEEANEGEIMTRPELDRQEVNKVFWIFLLFK
jgi:hypothetical protein